MIKPTHYSIDLDDEKHLITITPVTQILPGSKVSVTGVFKLSEGATDMGEIVFDDNMNQWEYTGLGHITHVEAAQIAEFIRGFKDTNDEEGFI